MPRVTVAQLQASDFAQGKPHERPRSSKWPKERGGWLKGNALCVACANTRLTDLEVHHVQPFHLWPELELDPSNFMTLCEHGPGAVNCHRLLGHLGDWKLYNPEVRRDAVRFLEKRLAAQQTKGQRVMTLKNWLKLKVTLADTEYTYTLIASLRQLVLINLSGVTLRWATKTGNVGDPTNGKAMTLLPGERKEVRVEDTTTLYYASSLAGARFDIEEWTD